MAGTRVTCTDQETGDSDSAVIENDYILITDGRCRLDHIARYADGTVVLTIKKDGESDAVQH